MKQRKHKFGCPRITHQIILAFGLDLDKDIMRRILAAYYKPDPNNRGPSWPIIVGRAKKQSVERGFIRMRIDIAEKSPGDGRHGSVPHEPMSHPFVERLIGRIRPELLDQTFLRTETDLDNKLTDYQAYCKDHRCHSSRDGYTPVQSDCAKAVDINQ